MKIEKTGWYKCTVGTKWFVYYDLEKMIVYGFNDYGDWFDMEPESEKISEENSEPATEQEATERLKAEAIKRGYVEGAEVVSLYSLLLETIEGIDYVFGNAGFFAGSTVIMKHGKWAEIREKGNVHVNANEMLDSLKDFLISVSREIGNGRLQKGDLQVLLMDRIKKIEKFLNQ